MSQDGQLRELTPADREQSWRLGVLAFGGDPAAPVPPAPAGSRSWGLFEGDRLVARAAVRSYTQWWGGRRVPMGGLAGVAVHPDARGSGASRRLVLAALAHLRADGQPVSVLFPTAPGLYRSLGWELVGAIEETVVPLGPLRAAGDPGRTRVRTAGPDDAAALGRLWQAHGEATDGLLTRDGPSFPAGPAAPQSRDLVALAEDDGVATGYLAYDRGREYGPLAQLAVGELVTRTPAATAALARSLGSWDTVATTALWRGPVDDLALLLPQTVAPPVRTWPWMLRVADAPGAVAARGWPAGVRTEAAFTLVDPQVPEHEGAWRLAVDGGRGTLERARPGSPRLHVRGLARVFAGSGASAALVRAGLLDAPVPGLDALTGTAPTLLDYF